MAADYVVQTQQRTVEVLGPSQVADVMRVGATTVPHNVYFERNIPITVWQAGGSGGFLARLAQAIEDRFNSGLADNASFVQDVDDSGLLTDAISFTVSIPPSDAQMGPMSTEVVIPVNLLTADPAFVGDLVSSRFDDALAALRATAGL